MSCSTGQAAPHWTAHTIGCENNRITTQTITLTLNIKGNVCCFAMRFSCFLPKWSLWLVNSKIAHPHPHTPLPPSICHFVLEKLQMLYSGDRHPYKNPTVRLKNRMQMPHPRTTLKFVFSSRKAANATFLKCLGNL